MLLWIHFLVEFEFIFLYVLTQLSEVQLVVMYFRISRISYFKFSPEMDQGITRVSNLYVSFHETSRTKLQYNLRFKYLWFWRTQGNCSNALLSVGLRLVPIILRLLWLSASCDGKRQALLGQVLALVASWMWALFCIPEHALKMCSSSYCLGC